MRIRTHDFQGIETYLAHFADGTLIDEYYEKNKNIKTTNKYKKGKKKKAKGKKAKKKAKGGIG